MQWVHIHEPAPLPTMGALSTSTGKRHQWQLGATWAIGGAIWTATNPVGGRFGAAVAGPPAPPLAVSRDCACKLAPPRFAKGEPSAAQLVASPGALIGSGSGAGSASNPWRVWNARLCVVVPTAHHERGCPAGCIAAHQIAINRTHVAASARACTRARELGPESLVHGELLEADRHIGPRVAMSLAPASCSLCLRCQ